MARNKAKTRDIQRRKVRRVLNRAEDIPSKTSAGYGAPRTHYPKIYR